jgi:hypothetical protein
MLETATHGNRHCHGVLSHGNNWYELPFLGRNGCSEVLRTAIAHSPKVVISVVSRIS